MSRARVWAGACARIHACAHTHIRAREGTPIIGALQGLLFHSSGQPHFRGKLPLKLSRNLTASEVRFALLRVLFCYVFLLCYYFKL